MSVRVPMRGTGAEQVVLAKKDRNGSGAKDLPHCAEATATTTSSNAYGRIAIARAKPLPISKRQVWEAYKLVKANGGAAGVDGQTLDEFRTEECNNLYKLWNRLASGSYMPPAVKRVEIPKGAGGMRPLGIPTVADRIAQMVVKQIVEPIVDPLFHEDSYGYRPGKSAHQALAQARQRCWKYAWVLELDIKGFFDNMDHELLLKAVHHHVKERWVVMYIERWLKAPVQMPDGTTQQRTRGVPQGGVISPLLSNLFLHYAFDKWMQRHHKSIPFERYADDAVCHCHSQVQAQVLMEQLRKRFEHCGLELHPQKTRVVYCKDADRRGDYPDTCFDFLGYTFRPRLSRTRWGKHFVNFSPAVSAKAAKAIRQEVRSWKLQLRSDKALDDLARMFNAKIRGWVNYYSAFYKSALYPTLVQIDTKLALWATRKYKRLRGHRRRARHWLARIARKHTWMFAHWPLLWKQASVGRAG
ncbi:Retron-type reverse transcriptase [Mycoavidus cysteinexigens]|uniref:Retron-type reverse transcriptase n=1 Tax=Mycoavidus cysteinexigens TaxID=1553431 RepID=A0A2Z6EVD6_9BURK|nr:group II intron reverse transcriptase/maturase [Mycoavidus cysteinexigens]BBE09045.1 Retron-type reverse transcriptase [Mycoavidus cysteinexigens]GAM52223.1 retron-type RNA-directed DNA polymerase [bacterium endosymbiont of Mortierella elongata FMR23-6]GLR00289.1 group II intron reverse transcriptase/maturase [Mycoavidus cysteinexigens]